MADLYALHERADVTGAPMLVGLDGWIDAGFAGANALGTMLEDRPTTLLATFDVDALLDHRSRRPIMHIVDGLNAGLTWPTIEVKATTDLKGRPVVFLVGAEPDHRWRAFSAAVVELHDVLGLDGLWSVGAYPAPVPHTRATPVIATAPDAESLRRFSTVDGRIDVPAGIASVIESSAHDAGIPSATLWAQVPHYAAGMPYPAAALALIEAVRTDLDLDFPLGSLIDDARSNRDRLDELVANNDDHLAMVRQLESQFDSEHPLDDPLPTGDDIVAELERFLREQE